MAPGSRGTALVALTMLATLLAIQVPLQGNYDLPAEFRQDYDELIPSFQPGTKILSARLFLWERARGEYFVSFDFRLMSLMALMGKQNAFYYSPMQQFYDSERLLPAVKEFMDSAYVGDREGCIKAADFLGGRVDYLHLHMILLSDSKNSSWGYSRLKRLADKSFLESCGVGLVLPSNGFPRNSSKNESVVHYVFRMNGVRAMPAIRS